MQFEEDCSDAQASTFSSVPTLEARLKEVSRVFLEWNTTRRKCRNVAGTAQAAVPLLSIIDERIDDLQRMLLHAGFDVSNPEFLITILQDDPEAMVELNILLGEARWQLREIIHEVHRRLEERDSSVADVEASALEWIERNEIAIEQL